MRTKLLLLVMALASQPALASGGLHCTADGEGVSFDVGGGVTHGMGGPLFSFEGTLEIADKAIAADLARTGFAREHVAQYWLDGEDLRLLLYREREGDKTHGYVELTIKTKARGGDDAKAFTTAATRFPSSIRRTRMAARGSASNARATSPARRNDQYRFFREPMTRRVRSRKACRSASLRSPRASPFTARAADVAGSRSAIDFGVR